MKRTVFLLALALITTKCDYEPKTFVGHSQSVRKVVFSPDSKMLASASTDSTIKIWSTEKREVISLTGHTGAISDLSFSPDNQFLASSSFDFTIRVWDSKNGICKYVLKTGADITNVAEFIAFSPNGKSLASVTLNGKVKIWNTQTGELEKTFSDDNSQILSMIFISDHELVIIRSHDIKIWKKNGEITRTKKGLDIARSAAQKKLFVFSDGKKIAVQNFEGNLSKNIAEVAWVAKDLAISSDGTLVASSHNGCLYSVKSGKMLYCDNKIEPGGIHSVDISPNKKFFAYGTGGGIIKLLNISKLTQGK